MRRKPSSRDDLKRATVARNDREIAQRITASPSERASENDRTEIPVAEF